MKLLHLPNLWLNLLGICVSSAFLCPFPAPGLGYAIRAWGDNSHGQLNIPLYLTNVVAIAGGLEHSLAVKDDGTVVGWGSNAAGQTSVPVEATNVVAVAAGYYHSLALRGDGSVIGWGSNTNGQINLPAAATNVTAIAAGPHSSLALRDDGSVIAWGQNQYGQTNVPAEVSNITAIACGYHGLGLDEGGTVAGWGFGFWGQTNGLVAGSSVTAIAAGVNHSLALKSNGTVIAWGRNFEGQTNVPSGLNGVVKLAAGLEHSMALKSNGVVVVWGRSANGETNVPPDLTSVLAIAAGVTHCLALTTVYPIYAVPVTLVTPVLRLQLQAAPGTEYELQYREAIGTTNDWALLDTVTPAVNPLVYFDESALGQPQRFYRMASATETSTLHAASVPRLTLDAEIGRDYRLEYRNATPSPTNWLFLDLVTLTNSPQWYYDQTAIGQPARLYQLFETNSP